MTQNFRLSALILAILAGAILALIFSQVVALKDLPTQIQVLLAGTTSTDIKGVPGAYPALAAAPLWSFGSAARQPQADDGLDR